MPSIDSSNKPLSILAENLKRCADRINITEEEKSELYECCLSFAERLVLIKKVCRRMDSEFESLSIYVAEEMYMLAVNKPGNVKHWISYMAKLLPQILSRWLVFEYGPYVNERANIPKVYRRYTPTLVAESVDRIYTQEMMMQLFKEANDYIRRCRRFSSKAAVLNAHMSLQLSLKYGRFINFRLSVEDERICRFIYNKYRTAAIQIIRNAQVTAVQYEEFEKFASSSIYDMNGIEEGE